MNCTPVYKRVDTCAAEFSTETAYMYSTYEEECEARPSDKDKILVLGGGPNRIGRALSLITAVCMRHWQCVKMV
jgi:carbamoyl-phosphate synthase large subunit